MRNRVLRAAALACLAVPVAAPAAGQSILLRLDPEMGLVSQYRMGMEMYMSAPMMSSDQPFMVGEIFTTQTVTGIEGSVREITTVTDSSNISTPAMPMIAQQMPSIDGQTQVMKMDDRGRVVELDVGGDLAPEAQQFMNQMGGGMGMELPENEVQAGDSWTARLDFGAPAGGGVEMEMEMEITFTLLEVGSSGGSRVATIAFEGPIAMSGQAGMDASGMIAGTMLFDVDTGRVVSNDSQVNVDMNAGGMALSMNQTMSMQLIGS